jgi:NAD dependent epimerase/dehydratase family enzyme
MRTIITGGTGLIGRALAESLAADGQDVILLSRTPEKAIALPAGVRAERWDGGTAAGWGALADGADAIVNLAGESIGGENMLSLFTKRWTPERLRLIRESRVNASMAVKQAIEAARQKPRDLKAESVAAGE